MFNKNASTSKIDEAVAQSVDFELTVADITRRSERRAWWVNTWAKAHVRSVLATVWASAIALVLFTAWIMVQGFRILTGQSREPMMGLVVNASRTTLILIAASTMALGGSNIQTFFTDTMASGINGLVTGKDDKPEKVIDKNLVYTAVAMAAIDGAQGLNASNSADNVAAAGRASLIAMLGVAGPPMTAAAMLLMYKVALALFIGFGPIFIMCLIFKVTEQMFWSWLKYGLGTLFSMAVLSFMVSIVLELTLNVAKALWAASAVSSLLNVEGSAGLTNQAMQQGGIGLLMTTLLISAPLNRPVFEEAQHSKSVEPCASQTSSHLPCVSARRGCCTRRLLKNAPVPILSL